MDLQSQLVAAATAYCRLRGGALATLADKAVRDPNLFKRLAAGGGCTLKTYERFFAYFAAQGVPDPVGALEAAQRAAAAADPRQLKTPLTPPRRLCGRPGEPGQDHQATVPPEAGAPDGAESRSGNGRAAPHPVTEPGASPPLPASGERGPPAAPFSPPADPIQEVA